MSRTSAHGTTRGLAHARASTWCHVGLSHASVYDATPLHRLELHCLTWRDWPAKTPSALFLPPLFLSSASSLTLAAAPLAISYFSPLIEARGATNRLNELVSQLFWVRTSSLQSHFLVFLKFRLNNIMW
jgi:hypothetical protein